MADMFYEDDADLSIIQGRKVAILGYGMAASLDDLTYRKNDPVLKPMVVVVTPSLRLNGIAGLHTLRRDDVATLTVGIQNKRDERGAIRVIFQTLNLARNAILVTLEVHQAVMLTVAATNMTRGDAAVIVATTRFVLTFKQRLVRRAFVQIRIDDADDKAAAR